MSDRLETLARTPTEDLSDDIGALSDHDLMRIATHLARKSYAEGGCPIGAVITDAATGRIIGKGHNTLMQENDATTHGETAAIRDAGRVAKLHGKGPVDFRRAILYTTLTPCAVCCAQITHRCQFQKVVIGDITNAPSTEKALRDGGIKDVVVLEDAEAVALYKKYAAEKPELHYLDWGGHQKRDEMRG